MWLLSTTRAELHFFPSPESVTGGYAILSHTWTDDELLFQDLVTLIAKHAQLGENPRDFVPEKIRKCCLLAEEHGYEWAWIDTCCIDKTSSTDLSEAINSMFRYYACAEVCYAHLSDVLPVDAATLEAPDSSFRSARWHKRCWTLQELIAPASVVFLASDWSILGDKLALAPLLHSITGIHPSVLTRESHFAVMSVAERMSWAANRRATRVEDEAYCLMGLFNVHMPTIYGEGRQAFERLQHEIMKQAFDTTIFAWGRWEGFRTPLEPMTTDEIYWFFNTTSQNHVYLLANSPQSFKPFHDHMQFRFTPSTSHALQPYLDWQWKPSHNEPQDSERRTKGPFGKLELPRFQSTSYGLECRLPVFESQGVTVAVLLCETPWAHVGLCLHPSNDRMQDPSRMKYNVGYGFRRSGPNGKVLNVRLVSLGDDLYNLRFNGHPVKPEWRDIYIADGPPALEKNERLSLCYPLNCLRPAPPFRIPHWLIGRLTALGMEVRQPMMHSRPTASGDPLQASVTFEDVRAKEAFLLILGTCDSAAGGSGPAGGAGVRPPVHWARAVPLYSDNWSTSPGFEHDCATDHVTMWGPDMSKDFGSEERTVRLSFVRSGLAPDVTLIVHVELEGAVYTALKESRRVSLPPHPTRKLLGISSDAEEKGPENARKRTLVLELPNTTTPLPAKRQARGGAQDMALSPSPLPLTRSAPRTPSSPMSISREGSPSLLSGGGLVEFCP